MKKFLIGSLEDKYECLVNVISVDDLIDKNDLRVSAQINEGYIFAININYNKETDLKKEEVLNKIVKIIEDKKKGE